MDIKCPDCHSPMYLDPALEVGDIVDCDECGAEIRIIQTDPDIRYRLIEEEK